MACKMLGLVYLPKYVVIHNPRLWILYWLLIALTWIIALWRFVALEQYAVQSPAKGTVSILPYLSGITAPEAMKAMAADRTKSFCSKPDEYEYIFIDPKNTETQSFPYTNINCAYHCDDFSSANYANAGACISEQEMFWTASTGTFVPTFFQDKTMSSFGDANPLISNYYVPGIESVQLGFSHDFFVDQPSDYLGGARETIVSKNDVTSVLMNHSGSVLKEFGKGEAVILNIAEMLTAANTAEYSETKDRLLLDGRYSRDEESILKSNLVFSGSPQGPTLRLTGADITVKIDYNNKGFCRLSLDSEVIPVDTDGPVACISVWAARDWTQETRSHVFDDKGASLSRTYHGFKVSFTTTGQFAAFDTFAFFESSTILFVWLQIPALIIYLFAAFALGTLSNVYNNVMHQDAGMIETARGIASRLLNYSATFNDLKDSFNGITKQRMLRRFNYILAYEEDLDANEQEKFVEFVYRSVLNVADNETPPATCDLNALCKAAANNESLNFQVLNEFFNRKRSLGLAEACFQDSSINAIRGLSEAELQRRLSDTAQGKSAAGTTTGSQLQDIEAENDRLRESCKSVTESLNETLSRAMRLVGSDAMVRFELNKQEVQSLGGESKTMPPQTLADGTVYDGEWVGAVRHGKGTMKLPDGAIFMGQFEYGMVHGVASWTLPSGAKYEGQWRLGKQDGEGKEISADGAIYQGQFKDGKKRGKARIYFPDGAEYFGEVAEGKLNGQGKYVWTNGQMYQGDWEDDMMQGTGTYSWPDGVVYVGQYRANQKHGKGTVTWPDKSKFEGVYASGSRVSGTMSGPDGKVTAEWSGGQQNVSVGAGTPIARPAETIAPAAIADGQADESPVRGVASVEENVAALIK
eukprot:TRINITY_DN76289_c0_g1_i1.p1 TRINITY_DN76289_c0_g1~~TRINITY_DN76289_c0_g1_i1.p1  ORF type:complete len:868 (-),score=193.39 TRINITY_DN76289_c0_g1_i1:181-2784(-)